MTAAPLHASQTRRAAVLVALGLLLFTVVGTCLHVLPAEQQLTWVAPRASNGDEPHYLVAVFSLLEDGDLDLTDDYRSANLGGPELGLRNTGQTCDHHTFWVARDRCEVIRWWDAFDAKRVVPCDTTSCTPFASTAPLPEGAKERPLHPPGYPVFLALLLWPFHLSATSIEVGVAMVTMVLGWAVLLLTFLCGRRLGWSLVWSLLPVGLVIASPVMVYVRSFFTEPGITFCLVAALAGFVSGRFRWAGAALGLAVCFKPNFLLFGAAWVATAFVSRNRRAALQLLTTFLPVAGAGSFALTYWLLCRWLLPMPDGTFWPLTAEAADVTFFSAQHGLFRFVPWFIPLALLALFGLSKPDTRLISVLVLLPTAAMTVVFLGNGVHPGYSYGPRYWVPMLPLVAVAGVAGLKAMATRPARLALLGVIGAGLFSALSALPDLVLSDGSSLFNRPPFIERMGP